MGGSGGYAPPYLQPPPSPSLAHPYGLGQSASPAPAAHSPTPYGTPSAAAAAAAAGGPAAHSALSPPSGVPQWPTRAVSETLFDFMHGEMIRYFAAQLAAVSGGSGGSTTGTGGKSSSNSDESRLVARRLHLKLESLGFSVGQRLVERCARDHPLLDAPLDIVKFVCKELWSVLFRKQIDKLQTNYKGIYVLHDLSFRWLQRVAPLSTEQAEQDPAQMAEQARVYTSLACGILRGALANLGLNASVKADLHKLPAVQFTLMEEKAAQAAAAAAATAQRPASGGGQGATAQRNAAQQQQQQPVRPSSGSAAVPPRPGVPSAR